LADWLTDGGSTPGAARTRPSAARNSMAMSANATASLHEA
jgi:hypothetical protein